MIRKLRNALIALTELVWPNERRQLGYQATRYGDRPNAEPAMDIVARARYEREHKKVTTAETVMATVVAVGVASVPLVYSIVNEFIAHGPMAWPTA